MKNIISFIIISFFIFSPIIAQNTDWSSIDKVFGKQGKLNGDVYKTTFPRTDLNITFDNKKIESSLALTSWIAFKDAGTNSMLMGDLVLLDNEIPSVENKLVENGIHVTGIHNHILGEIPAVKYLHFSAMGDPISLANAMKDVLSVTGTPMATQQTSSNVDNTDWSSVERTLRYTGITNGKVLQIGIPRSEKITEMGVEIPPYMGMLTTINIQKLDGGNAFATGDFVLIADEVNPVLDELIKNGITVTALHNHMLTENPRIFFMHYWGYDTPVKIALGLKKALDKTNLVKPKD